MEESPKHTLSILSLPNSVSTHLIDRVSDLSSVLVVNSLCFILSSSLGLCARFQSDPRDCHLVAVKRILRYLVATP
jgi:hypothetical protein